MGMICPYCKFQMDEIADPQPGDLHLKCPSCGKSLTGLPTRILEDEERLRQRVEEQQERLRKIVAEREARQREESALLASLEEKNRKRVAELEKRARELEEETRRRQEKERERLRELENARKAYSFPLRREVEPIAPLPVFQHAIPEPLAAPIEPAPFVLQAVDKQESRIEATGANKGIVERKDESISVTEHVAVPLSEQTPEPTAEETKKEPAGEVSEFIPEQDEPTSNESPQPFTTSIFSALTQEKGEAKLEENEEEESSQAETPAQLNEAASKWDASTMDATPEDVPERDADPIATELEAQKRPVPLRLYCRILEESLEPEPSPEENNADSVTDTTESQADAKTAAAPIPSPANEALVPVSELTPILAEFSSAREEIPRTEETDVQVLAAQTAEEASKSIVVAPALAENVAPAPIPIETKRKIVRVVAPISDDDIPDLPPEESSEAAEVTEEKPRSTIRMSWEQESRSETYTMASAEEQEEERRRVRAERRQKVEGALILALFITAVGLFLWLARFQ